MISLYLGGSLYQSFSPVIPNWNSVHITLPSGGNQTIEFRLSGPTGYAAAEHNIPYPWGEGQGEGKGGANQSHASKSCPKRVRISEPDWIEGFSSHSPDEGIDRSNPQPDSSALSQVVRPSA